MNDVSMVTTAVGSGVGGALLVVVWLIRRHLCRSRCSAAAGDDQIGAAAPLVGEKEPEVTF
jgi:hypothetical protein